MTPRERLIDLSNQRTTQLNAATAAMAANDQAAYDAAMERVTNLNTEIERTQNLITEQERQIDMRQPSAGEQRDMAEERAEILRRWQPYFEQLPKYEYLRGEGERTEIFSLPILY